MCFCITSRIGFVCSRCGRPVLSFISVQESQASSGLGWLQMYSAILLNCQSALEWLHGPGISSKNVNIVIFSNLSLKNPIVSTFRKSSIQNKDMLATKTSTIFRFSIICQFQANLYSIWKQAEGRWSSHRVSDRSSQEFIAGTDMLLHACSSLGHTAMLTLHMGQREWVTLAVCTVALVSKLGGPLTSTA